MPKGWTEQEDALLREWGANGRSFRAVARALGRSHTGVQCRAKALGVSIESRAAEPLDEAVIRERLAVLYDGWPPGADRAQAVIMAAIEGLGRPATLIEIHRAIGSPHQFAATATRLRELVREGWLIATGEAGSRRWRLTDAVSERRRMYLARQREEASCG